jgi:hypothetical protein
VNLNTFSASVFPGGRGNWKKNSFILCFYVSALKHSVQKKKVVLDYFKCFIQILFVESLAAKDFRNPEREHCAECENLVPT